MIYLIIPGGLQAIFFILGVISFSGLVLLVHILLIKPALDARADIDSPPPEVGFSMEIVIDAHERSRIVSVGQLDSDIKLRLNGIKEDHLVLKFLKERDLEDYHITTAPGGALFYRPPHAKKMEMMKSSETFESRELIGYPATFRVAASVKDNRPIQYVEFELSTGYFINNFGEEKMRFDFTLKKIFPSLDQDSRDKKGLYAFGRLHSMEQEQDQEQETEENVES